MGTNRDYGDFNEDGKVDIADLNTLLASFDNPYTNDDIENLKLNWNQDITSKLNDLEVHLTIRKITENEKQILIKNNHHKNTNYILEFKINIPIEEPHSENTNTYFTCTSFQYAFPKKFIELYIDNGNSGQGYLNLNTLNLNQIYVSGPVHQAENPGFITFSSISKANYSFYHGGKYMFLINHDHNPCRYDISNIEKNHNNVEDASIPAPGGLNFDGSIQKIVDGNLDTTFNSFSEVKCETKLFLDESVLCDSQ